MSANVWKWKLNKINDGQNKLTQVSYLTSRIIILIEPYTIYKFWLDLIIRKFVELYYQKSNIPMWCINLKGKRIRL